MPPYYTHWRVYNQTYEPDPRHCEWPMEQLLQPDGKGNTELCVGIIPIKHRGVYFFTWYDHPCEADSFPERGKFHLLCQHKPRTARGGKRRPNSPGYKSIMMNKGQQYGKVRKEPMKKSNSSTVSQPVKSRKADIGT